MKKWFTLLMLVSLMTITLVACGGEDNSNQEVSAEAGEKVTLLASNFEFDQEEYRVAAGDVTVELKNKKGMHGITIDGIDGFEIQNEGKQTVNLEPGEYTVRCSVPCGQGHMDMTTTIVVE